MLNNMIETTKSRIEMYEKDIESKIKDIQAITQTGSVYDIVTFVDSKVQSLKDIQSKLDSSQEQLRMLEYLKSQENK